MVQSPSWEANWFAASQEIPAFHGTRRFITALTSVRHLSLSWTSPIQSIRPHPTSWRSVLILSTHLRLGLPSGLFSSGFPTKTLYTPFSSPICARFRKCSISFRFLTKIIDGSPVSLTHVKCLVHILLLDFILNNIRLGIQIMKHLIIQPSPYFHSEVFHSGLRSKRRQYLFFALTYTICSTLLPPPYLLQS